MSTPQVSDNAARHQYELALDGKLAAHIVYRMHGEGVIDLIHTEVDPQYEGQGLASQIARFALDDARAKGRKVIATCSYIAGYVQKHPEYSDLVTRR